VILTLDVVGHEAKNLGVASRKEFSEAGGTIGRLPDNDWVLPDPLVSGHHARVRFLNGLFHIEDTSTNGVFVNSFENRLVPHHLYALKSGDRIFIEPFEIRASIDSEPAHSRSDPFALPKEFRLPAPSAPPSRLSDPLDLLGSGPPSQREKADLGSLGFDSRPLPAGKEPMNSRDWRKSDRYPPPVPAPPVVPAPSPPSLIPEDYDPLSGAAGSSLPAESGSAQRPADLQLPPPGLGPLGNTHFAAFAPRRIERRRDFVLDIWAYAPAFERDVFTIARREGEASLRGAKRALRIEVGTSLTVLIDVPGFSAASLVESVAWDGRMVNATFVLHAEPGVASGSHVGTAKIMSGLIPLGFLHFVLTVGTRHEEPEKVGVAERAVRSVFASYASEDRMDVLHWARGAELAGLDVFLDVVKLREGGSWGEELLHHVPVKDLFCLFWSEPASRSPWVDREWRCALAERGIDYIHPVPLADPRLVAPPPELEGKHFGGTTFLIQQYEQRLSRDRTR
jgi:hypothetical protein